MAQAKVTREQVRAQNKETLQGIIDNTNLSDAEKQSAVDQMVQMTQIAEQGSCNRDSHGVKRVL